jgi:FSR family fosmidomycin resistance protein-like MFS transporter
MLNDGYAAFFAPLLPLLIERMDLSLAFAGALGTLSILINSLLQPGLGHLIDRTQRPSLVVVGPLLTILAMGCIGPAASPAMLLMVMVASGVGTALFHPSAAALVGAEARAGRGLVMAFFSSGGTLGGALAPLIIVGYVGAFGLQRTPWLVLPGLVALAGISWQLRGHIPPRSSVVSPPRLDRLPKALVLLWTVIALRSAAAVSFANFLAVLVVERGGSPLLGGAAISVFLLFGAAAGFAAGGLSDRFGRKAVIAGSLALASPCLFGFLHLPSAGLLPMIAVAGLFTLGSTPVGVVAAQECLPGRTALVSGLVMGMAWGVGGLVLTPVGWLADRFGLLVVMNGVAWLPLLAGTLMLLYRDEPASVDAVP